MNKKLKTPWKHGRTQPSWPEKKANEKERKKRKKPTCLEHKNLNNKNEHFESKGSKGSKIHEPDLFFWLKSESMNKNLKQWWDQGVYLQAALWNPLETRRKVSPTERTRRFQSLLHPRNPRSNKKREQEKLWFHRAPPFPRRRTSSALSISLSDSTLFFFFPLLF